MTGQDGGFLGRWSRRKRDGAPEAAETPPADAPPEVAAPDAAADPVPEPEPDPDLLASLPRIEDITATTDIKVFLQKGVPSALRNAALRRAWAADPMIANYEDPARDYFWDYNTPGAMPGGGGTLDPERVARMVRDLAGNDDSQTDDSADAAPADPADTAGAATDDPAPAPAAPEPEPPQPMATAPAPEPAPAPGPMKPESAPSTRRRHGGAMPA